MLDKLVVKLLTLKMRASDERGQDIMEYAILSGAIAVALVAGIALFTGKVTGAGGFFDRLGGYLNNLVPH